MFVTDGCIFRDKNNKKEEEKKPTKYVIIYELFTNGELYLHNSESFYTMHSDGSEYAGYAEFTTDEEAIDFLQRFLTEGIHVNPNNYYLLGDICRMIQELITFIISGKIAMKTQLMSGNQNDSRITVVAR